MRNIIYIPDSTRTDLDQEPIFQEFMKEYIALLQIYLKKIKIKSDSNNTSHYTFICGQAHNRGNPSWQPFRLLSEICKKYNRDPLIARDIIEEKIHKRLDCECQILGNHQ